MPSDPLSMTTRRLELLRACAGGRVFRRLSNMNIALWQLPNGTYRTVTDRVETLVEAGLVELGEKPTADSERWRYGLTTAGDATLLDWTERGSDANPSRRIEDHIRSRGFSPVTYPAALEEIRRCRVQFPTSAPEIAAMSLMRRIDSWDEHRAILRALDTVLAESVNQDQRGTQNEN